MSDRVVGQSDRTIGRWFRAGVLQTDGSAWVRYSRVVAGAVEYLQANDSFNALLYEFPLTLVSDGFERFFTWPISAGDYVVTEQVRHSIYGFSASAEHFVATSVGENIDVITQYLRSRRREYQYGNLASYELMYDATGTVIEKKWKIYRNVAGTLPVRNENDPIVRRDGEEAA